MLPKTVTLGDGHQVPLVGLGTWASPPGEVGAAVKYAVKEAGYRHLDCAFIYQNEVEIGQALKELFDEGVVKREELFITTKVWNTYHSRAKVLDCCKLSLQRLGLDYVDLLLIHWPIAFEEDGELFPKNENGDAILREDIDFLQTWQGVEDCHKAGLTKSIGLSNFNSKQLQKILDNCTIKPVMNQVECHPYLNQEKLKDFCAANGITLTAYSPLGSPNRFNKKNDDPSLFDEPKILKLAEKYKKSPAQVMIRFAAQRGIVVIPKSVTNSRISENMDIYDFELTKDEIDDLLTVKQHRFICIPWMLASKYFPFGEPF